MATRRRRDSKGRFKKGKARKSTRKSSKRSSREGRVTCKTVSVCGKRRKICWGASGIVSNRPASGGGSKRKSSKKRKSTKKSSSGGKTYAVSRDKATKKNGRLKKGCRFIKGGGARCTRKNP